MTIKVDSDGASVVLGHDDVSGNVTGEGDVGIIRQDDLSDVPGNLQLAEVCGCVLVALAVDGGLGRIGDLIGPSGDGGVPVGHNAVLSNILEGSSSNREDSSVVVLNGVDAAEERTAGDGQRGGGLVGALDVGMPFAIARFIIPNVSVLDEAGEASAVLEGAVLDGHDAVVEDSVVGIAVGGTVGVVLADGTCFQRAGELAVLDDDGAVVEDVGLPVGEVVDGAVPGDGETGPERDGDSIGRNIGQLVAVQVEDDVLAVLDDNVLIDICSQLDMIPIAGFLKRGGHCCVFSVSDSEGIVIFPLGRRISGVLHDRSCGEDHSQRCDH